MADKSFGIKELNLIGASGTPTITSPNNLNLNASNVAISTDVTIGRHLDVDGHAEFDAVNVSGVSTFSGITTVPGPSLFTNQLSVSGISTFLGAINVNDSYGTSGQVLTSQGSGSPPTWQNGGKILQVVSSTKTTSTQYTPGTTWTSLGVNASITPSSTNSKILVLWQIRATSADRAYIAIDRGGTKLAVPTYTGNRINATADSFYYDGDGYRVKGESGTYLDSPSTTSSVTYTIQGRCAAGGSTIRVNYSYTDSDSANYGRTTSTITLMEVSV